MYIRVFMVRFFRCAFFVLLLSSCTSPSLFSQAKEYVVGSVGSTSDNQSAIQRLAAMMEGNYSSALQSKKDTSYLDIRLHIKRIWQERTDGIWLYVEQAVASNPKKPYRQRIYRLTQREDSVIESSVYTLHTPLRYVGEWRKPTLLTTLLPDSLVLRGGCSVFLHPHGQSFEGSTKDKTCLSDLNGASYITSSVTVMPTKMLTWDRGYDANGKLVWGEVKGPYTFIKQK